MNEPSVYRRRFAIFICTIICCAIFIAIVESRDSELSFKRAKVFSHLEKAQITAQSAYILNAATGDVVFERQAAIERPLASITKVMTAVVAKELWPDTEVVSASLPNLTENSAESVIMTENWRIDDLIKLMLTKSSNEAAEALVDHARKSGIDFVIKMNDKAKELQLWSSKFYNASGLDLSGDHAGAISTAEDVAFLLKFAVERYPDIFETTQSRGYNAKSEAGTDYFVENTNKVAEFLPGLLASKTGFTDLAGGNLAFAINLDSEMHIVVILGSTKEERFRDAEKITQALLADVREYNK